LHLTRDEFRKLRERHKFDWIPIAPDELKSVPAKGSSRVNRALHYVQNAMSTHPCIDKIVSYCSALEALFATSHSELTHLLAERTALVGANSGDERIATYRHVRDAYKVRSTYTHGGVIKEIDTTEMSVRLDGIVRRCLVRVGNDGELATALKSDTTLDNWFLTQLFS
jgi:hypothetical protein